METKHSPAPWKVKGGRGAGIQIFAPIPFKADCAEFTLKDCDQPIYSIVAYETWLQFPPKEWTEMQEANAELIAQAPELLAERDRLREENEALKYYKKEADAEILRLREVNKELVEALGGVLGHRDAILHTSGYMEERDWLGSFLQNKEFDSAKDLLFKVTQGL